LKELTFVSAWPCACKARLLLPAGGEQPMKSALLPVRGVEPWQLSHVLMKGNIFDVLGLHAVLSKLKALKYL
jgi:hypothetical protein